MSVAGLVSVLDKELYQGLLREGAHRFCGVVRNPLLALVNWDFLAALSTDLAISACGGELALQ